VDNKTLFIALLAVAAFSLLRIISQWRGFSLKRKPIDWDAHFISGLRKAGVDTFVEQEVDFFFTMPDRPSSERLGAVLRAEAYDIDIIEARETTHQFSLHASRRMRLIVPEMQQLTARFNELAASHGGKYDSWAVVTK
jgi:hypothetical protein